MTHLSPDNGSRSRASQLIGARLLLTVYATALLLGSVLVFFRAQLLPARFSYDSIRIQAEAAGEYDGLTDHSFAAIASLYRVLGLAQAPDAVAWLSFIGVAAVVGLACKDYVNSTPSVIQVFLVFVALNLGAVYLATYSKDVVVLAIALLCLSLRSHLIYEVVFVAALAGYGMLFREYWVLIAALYVGFRLLWRWMRNEWWLIGFALASIGAVGVSLYVFLGVEPDHFRETVNSTRSGSGDMSSAITRLIDQDGLAPGLVNVLATGILIAVPIPLLLIGSAYHLVVGVLVMLMWFGFFWSVRKTMRDESLRRAHVQVRGICLVLSVLVAQSLFEPDYGSALRHMTPLLALFVAIANRVDAGQYDSILSIPTRRRRVE